MVFLSRHEQTIKDYQNPPNEVDNYIRYLKDAMPVANLAFK